jgi:hypothetical protein
VAGNINVTTNILGNNVIATYIFGPAGATLTIPPAAPVAVPNIGPTIQTNINNAIAPFFPIPLAQWSTVYIAPHVYLEQNEVTVNTGAFSLGMDIKDGSQSVDVAVVRVEGAAPYTEISIGFGAVRQVPVNAIIKNRDPWNVAPPTDVTIGFGENRQVYWLPPLQPGEEFPVPFTVGVGVDANGSVTFAPTVIITADIGESTIVDPNRENNVFELTIDDDWFQSDYTVEIVEIEGLLTQVQSGEIIISSTVVSGEFTVTAKVRNIGGEPPDAFSLRRLSVYVNDTYYAAQYIGALQVGEEQEVVVREAGVAVGAGGGRHRVAPGHA